MLFHGPTFWKWLVLPGSLYLIEKILRYRKSRSLKHGETFIMEAIILPSQVEFSFQIKMIDLFDTFILGSSFSYQ